MLEGIWSVTFVSENHSLAEGTFVIDGERIVGGDLIYMFGGSYRIGDGGAQVEVNGKRYARGRGYNPIFGELQEFNLVLNGKPAYDQWILTGHIVEDPSKKIEARLKRQEELP